MIHCRQPASVLIPLQCFRLWSGSCVTLRPLCFHSATENICIDFLLLMCLSLPALADSVCLWVQEAVVCWLGANKWVFSSRSHCALCQRDSVSMKWNLKSGSHFLQQHQHLVVNSVPLVFYLTPKRIFCILLKWDYAPLGSFHVLSILEYWSFIG